MKNKPTKECKHDISGNMDNEYCSKCGMKYGHRYPQQSILSTILKEADKSFDEMYFFADLIPFKGQLTKREIDARNKDIKKFWHSQIELAYKAGQEEGYDNGYKAKHFLVGEDSDLYEIARKDHDNFIKQQTLKQIEEWCDRYNASDTSMCKVFEDLKKFINTL